MVGCFGAGGRSVTPLARAHLYRLGVLPGGRLHGIALPFQEPVVATLGNLDGVHRGHQALCRRVAEARSLSGGGTAIAIAFYPHPASVLRPELPVATLLNLRSKLEVLHSLGIEALVMLHFTSRLASMSAEDFVGKVLFERLNVSHLVMGPDAHVGRAREGNPERIMQLFRGKNRRAEIVPFVECAGLRVSSGEIRKALAAGELEKSSRLLGRPHVVLGRVVRGDGRGRQLGFRTANIHVGSQLLPKAGVYAGELRQGEASWQAVANVGVRPTFAGTRLVLEVHAPDYQGAEFYRQQVAFSFTHRLRDERKFGSKEELVTQIGADIAAARKLFSGA